MLKYSNYSNIFSYVTKNFVYFFSTAQLIPSVHLPSALLSSQHSLIIKHTTNSQGHHQLSMMVISILRPNNNTIFVQLRWLLPLSILFCLSLSPVLYNLVSQVFEQGLSFRLRRICSITETNNQRSFLSLLTSHNLTLSFPV